MLGFFKRRRSGNNGATAGTTAPVPSTGPRVRAPQTTVSLDWLLGLTGELADESPASIRFRENIESPNIKLGEVETWVTQSLVQPLEPQRLLALQDLANSIGKRLGFGVTYGRYKKVPEDWLQFDGLWRIENDLFATIDVYSVRLEGIDFKALAEASKRLSSSNKLLAKSELLHIFVLCEDYSPELEKEIRHSELFGRIRLLPITTLFEILKMYADNVVSASQLPFLFRPYDNIGVHNVILFLEQFIAGYEEKDPIEDMLALPPGEAPAAAPLEALPKAKEVREAADSPPTAPTFEDIVSMMDNGDAGPNLLQEYCDSNPDDLRAGDYFGDLSEALGDQDQALSAYEKVLTKEPAREQTLLKAVEILKNKMEYNRALSLVERTLPNIPRNAVGVRAELLLLAGKPAECRAICEEILVKEAGRPDLYRLMGYAFEREKAWSEAMACFEKAVQMSPSDTESKRRIAALRKKLQASQTSSS